MKKVYLLVLVGSFVINLKAQTFEWAKREGLYAYDYGYGVGTDNAGNVYVAGKYEEAAIFSGLTVPDRGNHDIFLAQYSPGGTLNWVKTGGGTNGDYAHAMACDKVSSVYIAGEIEGYGNTVSFDGSASTLTTLGDNDVFLAKYDLNGNLEWVKSEGGLYSEKALGVTYDNLGNVYICGYFSDASTTFNGTAITGYGYKDIFVAKYDMSGNFQWVQKAGGAGRDEALSIKCDAAGNVYVCGMYSDGAQFGTQTLPSPNGYYNAFLAKYTSAGVLDWVKTGGGDWDDVAWSLTIDNLGKIYVAGEFNGYALFDGVPIVTTGHAYAFVACYDASGTIQWAKGAGGGVLTRARGIGTDGTNLYITGQFGTTANFDSHSVSAADSSDVFMAALNSSGNFIWATSVSGPVDAVETLGYESGGAICADASGNVFATGAILDGGVFGTTNLSAYSRTDMFLTKISQPVGVSSIENNSMNVSVYPNPSNGSFTLDLSHSNSYQADQKIEVSVCNCLGQMINQRVEKSPSILNIDLSDYDKGIYFVEVKTATQTVCRKKIILQ